MSRPRRPKPEIEKAVQYAEGLGWRVELSNGGRSAAFEQHPASNLSDPQASGFFLLRWGAFLTGRNPRRSVDAFVAPRLALLALSRSAG